MYITVTHLKTNKRINHTGNHCSNCEMGVMCSHPLFPVSTRATDLVWKNFRKALFEKTRAQNLRKNREDSGFILKLGKTNPYLSPVFNAWEKTARSQHTHPDYVKMSYNL